MEKKLSIGDCDPADVSGANNVVYGIPASERDDGVPHVFVWPGYGGGCPEKAWHHRWLYLGKVPQKAVAHEVENLLESHEEAILAKLDRYGGTKWDGSNLIGQWPEEVDYEDPDELALALQGVATYWDASDWFAPVSIDQVATCDSLAEQVEHEGNEAVANDAHLDEDEVKEWLLSAARNWLDQHGDDEDEDEDDNPELRTRLEGWLEPD